MAALILGGLLLCACPVKVDPPGPDGPGGPDGPETPGNPDQPFFKIKAYNYESGNHDLDPPELFVFDRKGDTFSSLLVETNIDDWSVSSSESWCNARRESYWVAISAEPYETSTGFLYPRSCEVRIKAGTVYDKVIKIAQESRPFIHTIRNQGEYLLPPSGSPIDVYIITSLYDWQIQNNNEWLKTEKVDRTTLRVRTVPNGSQEKRSGEVRLFSIADKEPNPATLAVCYLKFTEGDPDLTGEDYHYGDGINWD